MGTEFPTENLLQKGKIQPDRLSSGKPRRGFIHGASESIPSLRRRAGTTLREQSIRFPSCNLICEKKLDRLCNDRLTPSLFNIVDLAKADVWSQWLTLSSLLVRRAGEQSVCCSCQRAGGPDDTHYMIPIAQTERILVATVDDVREIDDSPRRTEGVP
jgi:hypothetical protein